MNRIISYIPTTTTHIWNTQMQWMAFWETVDSMIPFNIYEFICWFHIEISSLVFIFNFYMWRFLFRYF